MGAAGGCRLCGARVVEDDLCDHCAELRRNHVFKPYFDCSVCERLRPEHFRIELVNEGRALHFCESHGLAAEALASIGIGGTDAVQILKRLVRGGG